MSNIPKFNTAQKEFIHAALQAAAPVGKIIDDLMEIHPQFREADTDIRNTLSDRITKIKARMPELPEKAEWQTIPHYLSAEWRLAYFRSLLSQTEDISQKIRLLGEVRKEVTLIDQHNEKIKLKAERTARRKEFLQRVDPIDVDEYNRCGERDPFFHDPNHIAHEYMAVELMYSETDWVVPNSYLSRNFYKEIGDNRYQRKCDGVVVDREGTPEIAGEKSDYEWSCTEAPTGIRIYDPRVEDGILPSVLITSKDHRNAFDDACRQGWVFPHSVLPIKAYERITFTIGKHNRYKRKSDGIIVDPLGVVDNKGEKDHHTWLSEQEGIYNYDPNAKEKTPTITDVLETEDSQDKARA